MVLPSKLPCTSGSSSSSSGFEGITCGLLVCPTLPEVGWSITLTVTVSASMFAVDGTDISSGLPPHLTPGPNQLLAERMGVVMGTSHHEPMSRNQKEFNTFGRGEWNFTSNQDFLEGFWRYGVERARGLETVFTVGMRGNGDLPLGGANVPVSPTGFRSCSLTDAA